MLQLHEFMGLNLAYLLHRGVPLDDLVMYDFNGHIIVAYAVLGLVVLVVKRRYFLTDHMAFTVMVVGIACQGIAAVFDYLWASPSTLRSIFGPFTALFSHDEFFELTAAFFYLAAFVNYSIHELSSVYDLSVRKT